MNSVDPDIQFKELSSFFTSDAWQLISSFLNNLQTKMDQFNITAEEQKTVFNGIEEFTLEFIENYKDKTKITFTQALGLIQDIGSPSEILQSMDLPIDKLTKQKVLITQEEKPVDIPKHDKVFCLTCGWPNELDSNFCDNCGIRITKVVEDKKAIGLPRIPHEIINTPYIASFLLSYLVLIVLGNLALVITYSPLTQPNLEFIPDLFRQLSDIPTRMFVPAVIIGLILGFVITRLYSDKLMQYDMHLIDLQKFFSLGVVLTLISLWLILIYIPIRVTRDEMVFLIIFLTLISCTLPIWGIKWNSVNKPSDIPYLTFLKYLKALREYNIRNIRIYNFVGFVIIFFIVTAFWSALMGYTVFEIPGWTVFGVPAWIALILSLLMLLNGVLLLYYYSWVNINRFIGFSKS